MITLGNSAFVKSLGQLRDPNYREYLRLLLRYGKSARYQRQIISFRGYTIEVPDVTSFIFQFKDIFVKQSYWFPSKSPEPVVYDCGANSGVSILYFKRLYPSAKIKAFEADPTIASLLVKNLRFNSAGDVNVHAQAIWTHGRGVHFRKEGSDAGTISHDRRLPLVPSVRLKNLLRRERRVDMLKMDIEGSETEVLEDCGKSLCVVRRLVVEYHSWSGERQRLDVLLKVLKMNGFRYYLESILPVEKPLRNNETMKGSVLQINIYAKQTDSP